MTITKKTIKNQEYLLMQVSEGLSVCTYKHPNHDFLMPTSDVAKGYGVSRSTLRATQMRYPNDFKEGTHFIKAVAVKTPLRNVQPHATLWTKAGIIQLGFHIQSSRAETFRRWAEGIIMQATAPMVELPVVAKRKHNRLNAERMVDILHDVCMIADAELRQRIANKLKGGQYNG